MMDSVALNVVISLVFIYSLYSLLVTTLNEGIASLFNLRAKTLEKGIKRMLTDNGDKVNAIVDAFYQQPVIKYLGEDNTKKPAYLSSQSFSNALVHLCKDLSNSETTPQQQLIEGIQKIKEVNPETGKYLELLYNDAGGKIEDFQKAAESWFNETMDRASGWYKKQTQKITLLVAFIVALSFNVDTIGIVKNLSVNPKLATQVVEMSDKFAKVNKINGEIISKSEADKQIRNSLSNAQRLVAKNSDIQNTNSILGLGWTIPKDTIACCSYYKNCKNKFPFKIVEKSLGSKIGYVINEIVTKSLIGLLLTALAISLGAPFWFDLLSKLMQLRGSKKADDNTPTTVTIKTT